MAAQILEQPSFTYLLRALANFIRLPATKMWLDYDNDADVLYVHFEEKPSSTHSEMTNEGVILDYRDDKLVGLTILDASQRESSEPEA
ncbi:DUF2283 domain-containing protein [Chloroflexi bacterium TSY]|nr:DUF2283 domain-containing protein [Chloroflexi bacterium TSY]